MYDDTADDYKYRSLRCVYRRSSQIESISFFLLLFKSYYFTLHLRHLQRDLRHSDGRLNTVDTIQYDSHATLLRVHPPAAIFLEPSLNILL